MLLGQKMSVRVLFVDDEQSLLNSIERRLGSKYFVSTAASGREALELLESSEPYPVIVTDMRMPWMEGLEFVTRAREIAPNSIYLMLTGNQDQDTAREAVNQASIFRFLRKPCHTKDLCEAIDAAADPACIRWRTGAGVVHSASERHHRY